MSHSKTSHQFYVQITAYLHQSRTLATLLNTLLPKLLSWELNVASAPPNRQPQANHR
jgi:hypothetical protein